MIDLSGEADNIRSMSEKKEEKIVVGYSPAYRLGKRGSEKKPR